jgi:hypothetical protein
MQSEQLVLHDPVVELESAGAKQQAAPPPFWDEAAPGWRASERPGAVHADLQIEVVGGLPGECLAGRLPQAST